MSTEEKKERAIVFIDGNNFYHSLKSHIFPEIGRIRLNYRRMSQKLVLDRNLLEVRYYIGRVRNEDDRTWYANQRKFIDYMQKDGIRFFFGRLEKHTVPSPSFQRTRAMDELPETTWNKARSYRLPEIA